MSRLRRGTFLGVAFGLGLVGFIYFWPILEGKTLEEISGLQERMQQDRSSPTGGNAASFDAIPAKWQTLYRESQEVIRRYLYGNERQKHFIVIRVLSVSELDRESAVDWSDLHNWPFERFVHLRAFHDTLSDDDQDVSGLPYLEPEGRRVLTLFFQLLETGHTDPDFREALTAFNDAHRKEGDFSP